ncbi:MAG TPA: LON peptidase substrate-binding domain-containing protein [Vicinamibacteria bacterium]
MDPPPGGLMTNLLVPVLPLEEICLFPGSSVALIVDSPAKLKSLELAGRSGNRLLALARKDETSGAVRAGDLHAVGTLAALSENVALRDGRRRVELDGSQRARVVTLVGIDVFVAEVEPLEEGDPGEEWGGAVEALARYLHSHSELRSFLDQQRRSADAMSWVNLACQHLPITATARQRLLEAPAADRCQKIGRGLDALLRKEQGA